MPRAAKRKELSWAAEHGLVSLRLSRPQFPWSDLDGLVEEAVTKIMGLQGKPVDERPAGDAQSGNPGHRRR